MPAALQILADPHAVSDDRGLLIVGRKDRLKAADVTSLIPKDLRETWAGMVLRTDPGD